MDRLEVDSEHVVPYRKHSSGDLHSRLKTRKVLGVGESNNGEVHRSKISQLLGHNDHLYVKFPRGYWLWHLGTASFCTLQGFLNLAFPGLDSPHTSRLLGCTFLGVGAVLWGLWDTMDKKTVKALLVGTSMAQGLDMMVSVLHCCQGWDSGLRLFLRAALLVPSLYMLLAVAGPLPRLRQSSSFKELHTPPPPPSPHPHREE